MLDDARQKIDAAAREFVEEQLADSILAIVPYLEPGDLDGISYQYMEDELPVETIERAKKRMFVDVRQRLLQMLLDSANDT